jgi:hypothetical protein
LENSGAGRIFYTQTNVSTGTSTGYTNWNSGEPNNNADGGGPYPLSTLSETALQFTGALGQWNDLANVSTKTLNYYVKETNLAASPLTINAGSGTVTFNKAVGSNKALDTLNVTANTIAINGGAVTTEGVQTYTGNITLGSANTTLTQTNANKDFTLQSAKSITNAYGGNATLTIKTTGSIMLDSSASIVSSSGALSTILWSDSDASGSGAIFLNTGSSIVSNGGSIILAGGTDSGSDGIPDGYAQGVDSTANLSNGVSILGASLYSNGGDITIKGSGANLTASGGSGNNTAMGVLIGLDNATKTPVTISSGTGKIDIEGISTTSDSSSTGTIFHGIEIGTSATSSAGVTITSSSSANDAITLIGDASGITSTKTGLQAIGVQLVHNVLIEAINGGISANATGCQLSTCTGESWGFRTYTDTADGIKILAKGPISISALGNANYATSSSALYFKNTILGYSSGSDVASSTGDITLIGDSLYTLSGSKIQSNGILTLKPYNATTTIGFGSASGTLSLVASYFSTNFTDGFSKIVVGSSAQTGNIAIGATILRDALTLDTQGTVTQSGAITGNQNLELLGTNGTYTLTNTNNDVASLTANTGSIAYRDSNALSLGNMSATGLIDIATLSGDLTLTGAINTTNATDSAIILNTGQSSAAGTTTGGNILISGGSINTGSGGRATLYTGSVSGSTGLSTLIGSGSGHFRYNSDEAATNYTATLGSGIYAVYREQPILSVTPANLSSTYGEISLLAETYTILGYKNGDNAAISDISGTAIFLTTATNTSAAGFYDIVYNGGLSNTLGYAIHDNSALNKYEIKEIARTQTPDVTAITNGTVTQIPKIDTMTSLFSVSSLSQSSFASTSTLTLELFSTPDVGIPTEIVSLQEAKKVFAISDNDVRIPLWSNSLIQLVNGGVHLPDGVEQQFFMAQR